MLAFPKRVVIASPRLNALYYTGMTGIITLICVKFAYNREYAREEPLGNRIRLSMWWEKVDRGRLEQIYADMSIAPFCRTPQDYNYWWGDGGQWRYENYTCLPLCHGLKKPGCVTEAELRFKEGADELFLPTEIAETSYTSDITGKNNEAFTNFYFVPYADAMTVSLTYSFELPVSESPFVFETSDVRSASSTTNVETVLLDSNGLTWKSIPPGDSISLSIPELLRLAGSANALDSVQPAAGTNKLEGAKYSDGPLRRITGLEVVLGLKCERRLIDSRNGPTCFLQPTFSSKVWTSAERVDIVGRDGGMRHIYSHGIRLRSQTDGYAEQLDFNSILRSLISAMVLLRIPETIVLLFATRCLGHLSRIYKAVVDEPFNITREVAGISTRLMASGVSYIALTDRINEGISEERMRERVTAAMKYRTNLDADEIRNFGGFCFWSITNYAKITSGIASKRGLREVIGGKYKDRDLSPTSNQESQPMIDVDSYNVACCSQERISLEDIVVIFDRDRRMGFLEKHFLPRDIRKWVMGPRLAPGGANSSSNPPVQVGVLGLPRCVTGSKQSGPTLPIGARQSQIQHSGSPTLLGNENNEQHGSYAPCACQRELENVTSPLQQDVESGTLSLAGQTTLQRDLTMLTLEEQKALTDWTTQAVQELLRVNRAREETCDNNATQLKSIAGQLASLQFSLGERLSEFEDKLFAQDKWLSGFERRIETHIELLLQKNSQNLKDARTAELSRAANSMMQQVLATVREENRRTFLDFQEEERERTDSVIVELKYELASLESIRGSLELRANQIPKNYAGT